MKYSRKRDEKKVKKNERQKQCTGDNALSKRMRITEVQSLNTNGYAVQGGQMKVLGHQTRANALESSPVNDCITDFPHEKRAVQPNGKLNEDIYFNEAKFDEYLNVVKLCTTTYESSESSDVLAEGPSMIAKMRGLLDPKVKYEVDYDEAIRDVSNVAFMWRMNAAAGKCAFIPDIEDRNLCYNAVMIFSHATEESKQIPADFCREFGKSGIHVYNDLLGIIGERDKNCLPFVNMCLRTWMERLSDDADEFAELYLFDFDKWVVDKLAEPLSNQHHGKTSYELMMAVFGSGAESMNVTSTEDAPPSTTLALSKATTAKTRIIVTNTQRPSHVRMSKLQKVGKSVQNRLIKSHYYRVKQNALNKATEEIEAAISSTSEGVLNDNVMRSCREASSKMEDLLFSVGGIERIVTTLRYFRGRGTVQELDKAMGIIDGNVANKNRSKEGKLNVMVMSGLREFLGMFRSTSSKGGGRRTLEDQNVFDAIMAAINTKELTSAKLGRMLSRSLNVSRRQIKRGRLIRADLEDMDKKNWVRRASTVPKNAIKDGKDQNDFGDQFDITYSLSFSSSHISFLIIHQSEHRAAISEWMHSGECSRVDNTSKIPSIVDLGVCPETGARMYDLHDRRELLYDDNEIIDILTGRDRVDKSKSTPPHAVWEEIIRSTTTPSRPGGIKGSTKLVRECKCSCMKKMRASVCSCTICERFKDALRCYNKYKVGWRHQAVSKRKKVMIKTMEANKLPEADIKKYLDEHSTEFECQMCHSDCHSGSKYHTFSLSTSSCASALLCDKVHVPQLDFPKLDINFREMADETDEFHIHPESCSYGCHVGFRAGLGSTETYQKCGWDATFKSMPMHERIVTDPTTGEVIKHCIRACPDEYKRGGKVVWMDFQKVARSESKSDDEDGDYNGDDGVKFQIEWLPVEGTVPEFFEHLLTSMEAYLPHAHEIKLSNRVDKCAERAFIIDPIADEDCPQEFKGVVMEVVDFASDIHAKRDHDTTCSFPETHKCEVHHLTFAPKFVTINEIEKSHPRTAKTWRKRKVDRVIRPDNVVIYCFGKAKGSAAYNQEATTNIISIIKSGKLPNGSKCEAFLDGKRIPGGDRSVHPPLPCEKLPDCENMIVLTDYDSLEPLYPQLTRWRRSRDGCAAQYQGKGAFRGFQTMTARHGIVCEDRRKVTMHGKDIADGDGSAVSGMVKKCFYDNYGKGTRNLVRHLAAKYTAPKVERHTRYIGERGLYASTKYIFMYLPEDGINNKIVMVDEGYHGSSKDHYYRSIGVTEDASRLYRRTRACGCRPCLKLEDDCALTLDNTTLAAGTTPRATIVKLYSARPTPSARHTRNARNPRPEFCTGLKIGENVIVRASQEERNLNLNEDYFVAKIERKAKKLDEGGMYSAQPYQKNDWIVYVRWYIFSPNKTNNSGDRFYSRGTVQWIPCNSIIRNLKEQITLRWSSRYYKLFKSLHTHIEEHGDLAY